MLEKAGTVHCIHSIVTAEYHEQETKTLLVKFQELKVHYTLISVTVCIIICMYTLFLDEIKVSLFQRLLSIQMWHLRQMKVSCL